MTFTPQDAERLEAWLRETEVSAVTVSPVNEVRLLLTAWREAEARAEKLQHAEHALSRAYVRLRQILKAFDTPVGPTGEQAWQHTEQRANELVAERDALRASHARLYGLVQVAMRRWNFPDPVGTWHHDAKAALTEAAKVEGT